MRTYTVEIYSKCEPEISAKQLAIWIGEAHHRAIQPAPPNVMLRHDGDFTVKVSTTEMVMIETEQIDDYQLTTYDG